MTPAQQSALEALRGAALTQEEAAALEPHLAIRNDVAIAGLLSVGRTRLASRLVSERGVRSLLGDVDAKSFLDTLRELSGAASSPAWLADALTSAGKSADEQAAILDTLACGWAWLRADGIDLGDHRTQALLDLLAFAKPSIAAACSTLKAAGRVADPIAFDAVSNALNEVT